MDIGTMGKVLVTAKIENLEDAYAVHRGTIPADEARVLEINDALVDTGATTLSLPKRFIQQLGLRATRSRRARTSAGTITVQVYEAVRLTVQERDYIGTVTELPDECPVLIGQLPLEQMDFVVDLAGQRLIGNPAHGGEQMIELY